MDNNLAQLPEPWEYLKDDNKGPIEELRKEVSSEHILFDKVYRIIARRFDMDDVLIKIENSEYSYAIVHLNWSGKNDYSKENKNPDTAIFITLDDFIKSQNENL